MSKRGEEVLKRLGDMNDNFIIEADDMGNKTNTENKNDGTMENNVKSELDEVQSKNDNVIDMGTDNKKNYVWIKVAVAAVILVFIVLFAGKLIRFNNDKLIPANTIEPTKKTEPIKTKEPKPTEDLETTNEPNNDFETKEVDIESLKKDSYVLLEYDTNWVIDLDGDGVKDMVTYEWLEELNSDDDYGMYDNMELKVNGESVLTIGGDDYSFLEDDYANLTISLASVWEKFAIVDLDNTDDVYQIATISDGPSGDPNTFFYVYIDGKFSPCGEIGCLITDITFNYLNTPGYLKGEERVDCIATTTVEKYMQYDKEFNLLGYVEPEAGEYVYSKWVDENGSEYRYELFKELYVYKDKSETSEKILMKPQNIYLDRLSYEWGLRDFDYDEADEIETVVAYWVYIKADDGTEGWVYVEHSEEDYFVEVIDGVRMEDYFGALYSD